MQSRLKVGLELRRSICSHLSAGVKDVHHHFRGALELSILLPGAGIIDVHYRACLVYLSLIISLAPSFIAHNVEYTVAYLLFTDCYLGSY